MFVFHLTDALHFDFNLNTRFSGKVKQTPVNIRGGRVGGGGGGEGRARAEGGRKGDEPVCFCASLT